MSISSYPTHQHTLADKIIFSGKGLHTGISVGVELLPSAPNTGLIFQRMDLDTTPYIPALAEYVTDTERGTTLAKDGAEVRTVEHLLAALVSKYIDNCLIQVTGVEIPILDGSARIFIEAIDKVGIKEQEAPRIYYTLTEEIVCYDEQKDARIIARPKDGYSITAMIDFHSVILPPQYAVMDHIDSFAKDIASARTFCFFHEILPLFKQNLIRGGDLDNAVVIVEHPVNEEMKVQLQTLLNKKQNIDIVPGYLNREALRFINEPARHKILDVMGDLALIGYPIKADILAQKSGHSVHTLLAKKIRKCIRDAKNKAPFYDAATPPLYDTMEIMRCLPHKHPFLLVDKIIEMNEKQIVGLKNVTFDEPFFEGHFPNNPIMPGVLQIEALAQTGGILALNNVSDPHNYDTYFLKIDRCKFKRKILPGDTMLMRLTLLEPIRRGICRMFGQVFVGGMLCTEAELVAQVIKTRSDSHP